MTAKVLNARPNLNLNKATVVTLERFGLDSKLAQDIVNYRNEHGPFRSFDELTNISGFSRELIGNLKKEDVEIQ